MKTNVVDELYYKMYLEKYNPITFTNKDCLVLDACTNNNMSFHLLFNMFFTTVIVYFLVSVC